MADRWLGGDGGGKGKLSGITEISPPLPRAGVARLTLRLSVDCTVLATMKRSAGTKMPPTSYE